MIEIRLTPNKASGNFTGHREKNKKKTLTVLWMCTADFKELSPQINKTEIGH
jgi:hypothetical protein